MREKEKEEEEEEQEGEEEEEEQEEEEQVQAEGQVQEGAQPKVSGLASSSDTSDSSDDSTPPEDPVEDETNPGHWTSTLLSQVHGYHRCPFIPNRASEIRTDGTLCIILKESLFKPCVWQVNFGRAVKAPSGMAAKGEQKIVKLKGGGHEDQWYVADPDTHGKHWLRVESTEDRDKRHQEIRENACTVVGCLSPTVASHNCSACQAPLHNLCWQDMARDNLNLTNEDIGHMFPLMFCGEQCYTCYHGGVGGGGGGGGGAAAAADAAADAAAAAAAAATAADGVGGGGGGDGGVCGDSGGDGCGEEEEEEEEEVCESKHAHAHVWLRAYVCVFVCMYCECASSQYI